MSSYYVYYKRHGYVKGKNGLFSVFSADDRIKKFQQISLVHLKDIAECFQKMLWLIGFGTTVCEILRVKILEKLSMNNTKCQYFQRLAS